MQIILLFGLIACINTYIIETIAEPQNKTCVSEIFIAGEPISILTKVTETPKDKYALYLTIENESHDLLAHKKYDISDTKNLLTYNNDSDQSLSICIDNFESFPITVELNIKFRQHLANLENSPTSSDYAEIEDYIEDIANLVNQSYAYFTQNEDYVDKIVNQSNTLEWSLMCFSIFSVLLIGGAGSVQLLLTRQYLKTKKLV